MALLLGPGGEIFRFSTLFWPRGGDIRSQGLNSFSGVKRTGTVRTTIPYNFRIFRNFVYEVTICICNVWDISFAFEEGYNASMLGMH